MTLPVIQNSPNQVHNSGSALDVKSSTPNPSPQSSPLPTKKIQHKREPSSVSKEIVPDRSDSSNNSQKGSPSSESSGRGSRNEQATPERNEKDSSSESVAVAAKTSRSERSSVDLSRRLSVEPVVGGELIRSNSQEPVREKKSCERTKKKTPWYSALYPTYKSRSDDFRRIFKDIPDDERLVVDYSCAIQRDILVHGRLYVSQNYLCFYANLFRWETQMVLKWKEVTAMSKEKTALVIPNAILVHTAQDKHFLTSFVARDKAHVTLFRVWQNALMEQPMSTQELWQWVHKQYGDELGLTSDDDDYVAPNRMDDERNHNYKKEAPVEWIEHLTNESEKKRKEKQASPQPSKESSPSNKTTSALTNGDPSATTPEGNLTAEPPEHVPTDPSDSSPSESESEKNERRIGRIITCPVEHEGRLMLELQVSIHVDQLFTHLFTNSKFIVELHEGRKNTDVKQGPWTLDSNTNQKTRTISLTVLLGSSIGPKTSQVTESQKMMPCTTPGEIYAIETEAVNGGIPYADAFSVVSHYCLIRGVDANTSLIKVYCHIRYKKSVWGLVKSFIEKNCWLGLEDYFNSLVAALEAECERTRRVASCLPHTNRKPRRSRNPALAAAPDAEVKDFEDKPLIQPIVLPPQSSPHAPQNADTLAWIVFLTLFLLLVLNAALYYKLWGLEQSGRRFSDPTADLDLDNLRFAPRTPDEWRQLLQKQEQLHTFEVERWLRILKASVHLLQQVESSLSGLQASIQGAVGDSLSSMNDDGTTPDPLPTPNPDL